MTRQPNISTEHQPKGAGLNPSDTLDKPVDSPDALAGHADRQPPAPRKLDSATARIDDQGRPMPDNNKDGA